MAIAAPDDRRRDRHGDRSASTSSCWRHSRRNSRAAPSAPRLGGPVRRPRLDPRRPTRRAAGRSNVAGPCHREGCGRGFIGLSLTTSSDSGPSGGGMVWSTIRPSRRKTTSVGPRGQLSIVGDHDAGDTPLAGGADQPHHGLTVHRVEGARWLVGEQQAAVTDHGAGDRHPLALAAGQLVREVRGGPRSASPSSSSASIADATRAFRAADPVELQRQRDVLHRGKPGEQVEVLEDVADRAPAQPRLVVARQSVDSATPPTRTSPVWSAPPRLPAMVSSVLLPEPLGPITATSSSRRRPTRSMPGAAPAPAPGTGRRTPC